MVRPGAGGCYLSSSWTLLIKPLSSLWPHSKTAWDTFALSLSTSPRDRPQSRGGCSHLRVNCCAHKWSEISESLHTVRVGFWIEWWRDWLKNLPSRPNHLVKGRLIEILFRNSKQLDFSWLSFLHLFLSSDFKVCEYFQNRIDQRCSNPSKVLNYYCSALIWLLNCHLHDEHEEASAQLVQFPCTLTSCQFQSETLHFQVRSEKKTKST